jgi:hypothetical protein
VLKRIKNSMALATVGILTIPALALAEGEPTGIPEIDMTTIFESITSGAMDGLIKALPYAAVVFGALVAIRLALKIYKLVTAKG